MLPAELSSNATSNQPHSCNSAAPQYDLDMLQSVLLLLLLDVVICLCVYLRYFEHANVIDKAVILYQKVGLNISYSFNYMLYVWLRSCTSIFPQGP